MTSAATTPDLTEYEDDNAYVSYVKGFSEAIGRGVWEHYLGTDVSSVSEQLVIPRCVIRSHSGTGDYAVTLIQYGEDSNALIIVDFGETATEFPKEQQEVVNYLRENGRPILAGKLITLLRNVREDPNGSTVNIISLREMARLLVTHENFSDPFVGPDRRGIVHAQWRIMNNGVLVVSFLGYGEILLVAQADENPDNEALDISARGLERDILGEYGHLVPRRH